MEKIFLEPSCLDAGIPASRCPGTFEKFGNIFQNLLEIFNNL
jgi:hypothetical protein